MNIERAPGGRGGDIQTSQIEKAYESLLHRPANSALKKFYKLVLKHKNTFGEDYDIKWVETYIQMFQNSNDLQLTKMPCVEIESKDFGFRFIPDKNLVVLTRFWKQFHTYNEGSIEFHRVIDILTKLCDYNKIKLAHDDDDSYSLYYKVRGIFVADGDKVFIPKEFIDEWEKEKKESNHS